MTEQTTWLRAAGHRAVQLLRLDPGLAANAKGRIFGISREGIATLAGVSPATYRTARNRGWLNEDDPLDVLRWVLAQRRARAHPDYEAAGIAERAELLHAADEQARAAVAKIRRILAENETGARGVEGAWTSSTSSLRTRVRRPSRTAS